MRFKFTPYPEARERLAKSGLEKRIITACKKDSFPNVFSAVYPDEFRSMVDEIKGRGFYKNVPKELGKQYYDPLQNFARKVDLGEFKYSVRRQDGEANERAENEDFMLVSGYLASHVLKPREFWAPESFGFSSLFDFFGTIGARAWEEKNKDDHREGYVWNSQANDRLFHSQVTGDINGDFRFYRNDITPYETTDPLGHKVSYRPEMRADHQSVAAYHSTEISLLVAILKYVEQENIHATNLAQKGLDKIADELKKSHAGYPNYADFGMGNDPLLYFSCFSEKIPSIDEKTQWNPYGVGCESGGRVAIYVGRNKELVFQYENNNEKKIVLELPSQEIDHLIKGLFVQTHAALGMIEVLVYYSSPQFKEDQKRFARA